MPSDRPAPHAPATRTWWRRLGPWVAIGTSPAALMVGGGIAEGNERWWLAAALVTGVGALAALAAAEGMLGVRHRQRFGALAAAALGPDLGRRVASPVVGLMMLGWFAFNTSVAGAAVGELIGVPMQAGVALFAAVTLAVAWWGLDILSGAALLAGAATTALAVGGLRRALADHTGPLLGDGRPAGGIGMMAAAAVIVGYGAAFALRTPDFTHDLARPGDVARCAAVGLALPLVLFLGAGAVLQLATGSWNLVDTLQRIGSPGIAYAFVAVGVSGSVLTNLHSGAIAIEDVVPRVAHRTGLVVVALVGGGVAALDFARWMIPYLTTMALTAPCLIAVLRIADRRARRGRPTRGGVATLAWAAGAATGGVLAVTAPAWALPAGLAVAAGATAAFGGPRRPEPGRP